MPCLAWLRINVGTEETALPKTGNRNMKPRSAAMAGLQAIEATGGDILCGRGKKNSKHPGSIAYWEFVERHAQGYSVLVRNLDKTTYVSKLASDLSEAGHRFLGEAAGGWILAGDHFIRQKIMNSLQQAVAKKSPKGKKAAAAKKERMQKALKEGVPLATGLAAAGPA